MPPRGQEQGGRPRRAPSVWEATPWGLGVFGGSATARARVGGVAAWPVDSWRAETHKRNLEARLRGWREGLLLHLQEVHW